MTWPGAALASRRMARDGAVLVGVIALVMWYGVLRFPIHWMADGHAYWSVDASHPWLRGVGHPGAFTYSPPAAALFVALGHIPEPLFLTGWTALSLGIAVWLLRPYPIAALALALPLVEEITLGQVELILAAAIVLGFRWPWTWTVVLLTKSTAAIGLLWFVIRREWRQLAEALVVTAAIVAASLVAAPEWWREWLAFLQSQGALQALVPRLAIAIVVVAWGARTDRRWAVPVAAVVALPAVWLSSLAMLAAAAYLARADAGPRAP